MYAQSCKSFDALSNILCSQHSVPRVRGVHLKLFADDICLYVTDRGERFTVRKLRIGLIAV
jgi:hypothetical protein